MPQSLSRVLVHLIFSTKNRDPVLTPLVQAELHPYLATVLDNAGPEYRLELEKQLASGSARVWVPAARPLNAVWRPSADLTTVDSLPVLILYCFAQRFIIEGVSRSGLVDDIRIDYVQHAMSGWLHLARALRDPAWGTRPPRVVPPAASGAK